jgi:hypothetical protein
MLAANIWVDSICDSTNPTRVQDAFGRYFVNLELGGQGVSRVLFPLG